MISSKDSYSYGIHNHGAGTIEVSRWDSLE